MQIDFFTKLLRVEQNKAAKRNKSISIIYGMFGKWLKKTREHYYFVITYKKLSESKSI
jgi:hypothetical protein